MTRSFSKWGCITCITLATSLAWGGDTIDLAQGWRFAPDPDQSGLSNGWHLADLDDSSWALVQAGMAWEDQGFAGLDGVGWYRKRVAVPEEMRAERAWLTLGAINDSGVVYCNGHAIATFGDDESITLAYDAVAADLSSSLRWGQENVITIRVFDWGDSGGLNTKPCALTTDPAVLPIRTLLPFVPGFDGGRSIVGVELLSLGIQPTSTVRISAAVNDTPVAEREARIMIDHEGRAVAVAELDLDPTPGDRVLLTAKITGRAGESGGPVALERLVSWPEPAVWPEKYRHLRVLNNFVTELHSVASVPGENERYPFLNPREGWVFIRIHGNGAAVARVDGAADALVWRKHPETGDLEAMQYLAEGEHELGLDHAQGARVDIRAVPEIAFCYWPTTTVLPALPTRDRAFAERHIFPNMNTLLTHNNMTEEEFERWKTEGRRWLNNSSLPGLHKQTAPTADDVYQEWAANACITRPGYSGLIVDEFLSGPAEHYAAWTSAVERLHANPGFNGQKFYAWVVDTYRYEPALAFMRRLYELGGRFAWERYLLEQPTEEMAMLRLYKELGGLEEWEKLMPGVKERLTYCLGSFTIPWCSLNINPAINYLPFMDRQFQVLATDPLFFGSLGIFQWAEHYTDDDALRYAQALYRHYCIEGHRTRFADYPYRLTHIGNPDFADGLDGWRVDAAGTDSVMAGALRGLGNIQGRWTEIGVGDQCAIMVRNERGPNRISQSVKDLEPGRLYSMKFMAVDLDHLTLKEEVGLWPELQSAELEAARSFRAVMRSPKSLELGAVDGEHPGYMTYGQVMFRPKGGTAELTFSDWNDGKPAGPAGQRIGFNFIEIQPYYE